jgi:hypothetical protein
MSLGTTWYTVEEAAAKLCLEQQVILKWAAEGIVRAEEEGGAVVRVNMDDLDLKVREMTGN